MKIRSILVLASALFIACGSEESVNNTPDLPPGIDAPAPPGPDGNDKNNPTGKLPADPVLDGGSDQTDAGAPDTGDGGSDDQDSGSVDIDAGTDPDAGAVDGGTDTDAGDQDGGVTPPPTTTTVGCLQISLVSVEGNTFCYQVTEQPDSKNLSHWDLATNCAVASGTPSEGFVPGTDPKSGLTGVKWNTDASFTDGTFCVTVDGNVVTGEVQVASKCGLPIEYSTIAGPICQ